MDRPAVAVPGGPQARRGRRAAGLDRRAGRGGAGTGGRGDHHRRRHLDRPAPPRAVAGAARRSSACSASAPPSCAATRPAGCRSTSSTTCATPSSSGCSASTSPRTTACRPASSVSRASSDVALIQGLLSFLPIVLGNLVLLVVALVVMVILSPPLTAGGGADPAGDADRRPAAAHGRLPRDVGRPAARRRGGRRGRRGGDRRAGGQGVRAGGARAAPPGRLRRRPVPVADAADPPAGAVHADAAGHPRAGPGGGARLRRLAGDRGPDDARHASSRSRPTWCSWWRRCGCSPGCSRSASRPGPAASASSTCSTPSRSSSTAPTPARWRWPTASCASTA